MALKAGCQEAVVLLEGQGGRRGEQLQEGGSSEPSSKPCGASEVASDLGKSGQNWSCSIS